MRDCLQYSRRRSISHSHRASSVVRTGANRRGHGGVLTVEWRSIHKAISYYNGKDLSGTGWLPWYWQTLQSAPLRQATQPLNTLNVLHMENHRTASTNSLPLLEEAEIAPARNCYRLVILGSAKVGKTSIVSRFLNNKYDDKYTPTIEDFHRKVYRIKGEAYRLDILDTSGNHPFPAMRRLSLLTGMLFLNLL